jgi:hypothetical protein
VMQCLIGFENAGMGMMGGRGGFNGGAGNFANGAGGGHLNAPDGPRKRFKAEEN